MNGDGEREVSEMRQKDVGLGINKWLEDPGSIEKADKFLSKLMTRAVFAPIGKAVVYAIIALAVIGSAIIYLWSKAK